MVTNIISVQAPSSVVMIRPHCFISNPQTAADNSFQNATTDENDSAIANKAYKEASQAADLLSNAGVEVHLFEDEADKTPDSVFPNNWFSTHAGGHVAIYPMYTENRRMERRQDIIEMLKRNYRVQDIIDYSGLEYDNLYLEGTGAMVIDHIERVAYAARSKRTSEILLERFCTHFNYEPIIFDAADETGNVIYHTNVLMCIGSQFAMIGLECITDEARRFEIAERLGANGRQVIPLTQKQISDFAGNAIELQGNSGLILALSTKALNTLDKDQRKMLEQNLELLPLEIPTIELAGGSVRCMLAGIHLSKRQPSHQISLPN